MRIVHRIGIAYDEAAWDTLHALGLDVLKPAGLVRIITFDIDEAHPAWPLVEAQLRNWQASDIDRTEFDDGEMESAEYLQMVPHWHCGYPQPSDDFGYLQATYDLTDYCSSCGIGKVQRAPFRLRGEPKWGKRHLMQLHWVFDEIFATPQSWQEAFQPLGIESQPVLDDRTGEVLKSVVQILIPAPAAALDLKELSFDKCGACGRAKYAPVSRGRFPRLLNRPDGHLCQSNAYFGSGASAARAIIASEALYRAIKGHRFRGMGFVPLLPVPE